MAQWECASHISSEDSDTKIAFFRRTNQGKTNFVRQSQQYLQNLVNISLLVLNHRCGFTAELPTSLSKKKFKGTQTKIWNLQLKSTFFVYFHNNTSTRHSEQHQNAVFCTMQYNAILLIFMHSDSGVILQIDHSGTDCCCCTESCFYLSPSNPNLLQYYDFRSSQRRERWFPVCDSMIYEFKKKKEERIVQISCRVSSLTSLSLPKAPQLLTHTAT